MVALLPPSRAQLARICNNDPDAMRLLEQLFKTAGSLLPSDIIGINQAIASINAQIVAMNGIIGQSETNILTLSGQTSLLTIDLAALSGVVTALGVNVAAMQLATTIRAARIYRTSTQVIPTGAGYTNMAWDAAGYQQGGNVWTSGANLTILFDGIYQFYSEVTYDGAGLLSVATANMQIAKNGTTIKEHEFLVAINAKAGLRCMAQRPFVAGDVVTVRTKHSNPTDMNVINQGDYSPNLIMTKLAGT